MSQLSLLEKAAEVRAKAAQLEDKISSIRAAYGEWISLDLAANEAKGIADEALRRVWSMLERLNDLADVELRRSSTPGQP